MIILGIETSCDETAAALVEVRASKFKILSNVIFSQIKIHQKYGGVVPEVAARNHVLKILLVIKKSLKNKNIDAIAVTTGPGLITSLLVGTETAKVLTYVWNKPLIAINHIEAHICANFVGKVKRATPLLLSSTKAYQKSKVKSIFPAMCLVVSGGHTELILIKKIGDYKKIGQTRDDAAGECFDKVAKLLNVGYPGGPIISRLAKKGNPQAFDFPRPMIDSSDFDFSFSGLKTAALYLLKKINPKKQKLETNNLCASVQQAIVDVLVSKTTKAAKKYKVKTIMLAGGVAANNELRKQLKLMVNRQSLIVNFLAPPKNLCTDNAAMVAIAGYYHFLKKDFILWQKIKADPNLEIA